MKKVLSVAAVMLMVAGSSTFAGEKCSACPSEKKAKSECSAEKKAESSAKKAECSSKKAECTKKK